MKRTVHPGALRLAPSPRPGTPKVEPRIDSEASPARAATKPATPRGLAAVLAALVAISLIGAPYYFAAPAERVRSIWHPWLRPSGYIGQSAGILALLIFLFLWLYPFRKKYRWLAWTGSMSRWMDAHVLVALALPLIAAIHASWRFEGLIGLGYLSMLVVCASGIAGRYLYVRIPRGQSGLELSAEETAAQRSELIRRIASQTGLPAAEIEATLQPDPSPTEGLGLFRSIGLMLKDDLSRRRAAKALRDQVEQRNGTARRLDRRTLRAVLRLANREMALTQQARMLEVTHRLFRYWHVAHRPFAITALVAVLIHVGVVVALGATWFW
ncbi:MAG TPA: hypothetical protein VH438_00585 [Gemmatimonadales bacterium]